MSPNIDAAIIRIRAFAQANAWGKCRLAVEAGINITTLRNFDKPGWNPTVETLRKIEAIIPADFECPPELLIHDPHPTPTDTAA
jgi:hypothetical protein